MTRPPSNPPQVLSDLFPRCEECGAVMFASVTVPGGIYCPERCGRIQAWVRKRWVTPGNSARGCKIAREANSPLMFKWSGRDCTVRGEAHTICSKDDPGGGGAFRVVWVSPTGLVFIRLVRPEPTKKKGE